MGAVFRACGAIGRLVTAMIMMTTVVVLPATAAAAQGDALIPVPPMARVTDLGAILGEPQRTALEARLAALEQSKGSQIAVLILPSVRPETIEQYTLRVFETWKLGRATVDDGALLVVATQDRELRIEVGYGLEGAIPDAIAKRVIEERMLPRLRAGDPAGAVDAGVESLMGLVRGEPLPQPPARRAAARSTMEEEQFPFLVGLLAVMTALCAAVIGTLLSILGRLPAATSVAGLSAGAAWWMTQLWPLAAVLAALGFLIAFLIAGSRLKLSGEVAPGRDSDDARWDSDGGHSWSSNDSVSSSGGGSDDFSGGGGSSGGGGASGRW